MNQSEKQQFVGSRGRLFLDVSGDFLESLWRNIQNNE